MDTDPRASRHLGLDLGGTNIKWVVVERAEEDWHTLDHQQVATPEGDARAVVDRMAEVAAEVIALWPGVSTLGVGVPGLYDPQTGATRFLPNVRGEWSGFPVAQRLSRALDLPVRLVNDARAFGLAELRLGAGRGARSMIGFTLGTGVGGVIALDGHVVYGRDGTAGELGHQTIEPDGPWCGCGNRGCLEAFVRGDQIAEVCGASSAGEAVSRARSADARALAGMAEVGRYLGIGIANMLVVFTPDRVVIGGGIAPALDLLRHHIWQQVRQRVHVTSVEAVEIVAAQLGTWAGGIGAAIHAAETVTEGASSPAGTRAR